MTEPRHRAPTIHDVAAEAGVSKSSAARVLAGVGSASPRTRERVQQAAEKLGYRANALAKAVRSGSSHLIGAVVPDASSPYFSLTLRGVADAARAAGFEVIVANTDGDPRIETHTLEVLAEKRVDGLIIAPALQAASSDALLALADRDFPMVLIDRRMPSLRRVPLVAVDNVRAIRQAVDHLVERGHRDIAIVTDAADDVEHLRSHRPADAERIWRPSVQRLSGYLEAMSAHGLDIAPEWLITMTRAPASARQAISTFLENPAGATAILCTDAGLTYAAYRAAVDLGVSTPDDFSFVGFDDQDWTTVVRPTVTVVDQPRYELGKAATGVLLDREAQQGDVILDTFLIERGTSAMPDGAPTAAATS